MSNNVQQPQYQQQHPDQVNLSQERHQVENPEINDDNDKIDVQQENEPLQLQVDDLNNQPRQGQADYQYNDQLAYDECQQQYAPQSGCGSGQPYHWPNYPNQQAVAYQNSSSQYQQQAYYDSYNNCWSDGRDNAPQGSSGAGTSQFNGYSQQQQYYNDYQAHSQAYHQGHGSYGRYVYPSYQGQQQSGPAAAQI